MPAADCGAFAEEQPTLRPAHIADVVAIQRLVSRFSERGEMLPRALHELYEGLRDFTIAEADGEVVGCVSLHVNWANLAEVRSLAVAEEWQGRGLGRRLVEACVADARRLGIATLYCLTNQQPFFERLGFTEVDRGALPRKVWSECVRCPRFNDCPEVAMTRQVLDEATPAPPDPLASLAALPRRHGH